MKLRNWQEVEDMPAGVVRDYILTKLEVLEEEGVYTELRERAFNDYLGGDFFAAISGEYAYETLEELRSEGVYLISNDSPDEKSCEYAVLKDGVFDVFWAKNNAGGPVLFVADKDVPPAIRLKLCDMLTEIPF
jgi:hypothetical protein